MHSKLKLGLAAGAAIVAAAPATAGEITGNGKDLTINARSECAYSGRNDTPEGIPYVDPGGRVQSYGQYIALNWFDARDADPQVNGFPPTPGYSCNPNRGLDLHAGK